MNLDTMATLRETFPNLPRNHVVNSQGQFLLLVQ